VFEIDQSNALQRECGQHRPNSKVSLKIDGVAMSACGTSQHSLRRNSKVAIKLTTDKGRLGGK
jgi:hypothetical protein